MMEETGFSEKKLLMKEKYVRKSYGTIVQSSRLQSPSSISYIRHDLQPDDTLQGVALRYGCTMEQIKRANRLLTTDSIFMRAYLLIPVPEEGDVVVKATVARSQSLQSDITSSGSSRSADPIDPDEENRRDIENFLSRMDNSIATTKKSVEEKRKHSDFLAATDQYEPEVDEGARVTYEGAYQSLNRASTHHPDRRRIRSSLDRLEKQQDELFEL